ncbi:glycerol-3-phosphate dehydrogenase/oxidase [Microbacterium sp. KUDC0406]|uniref:glycerol-3-phosphate dehydrogenase/oxidase n=1 Tax=Microbacterium sp. KUDC0406 TaxID=2909588 RepID=UPI001F27CB62|nr:glycerol-3-phosphate dehydrogenase/oxidase [Microbacterium sp. KUDC0406]UJP10957.1 glycerol-3-phosphate dehydrogenase/oxidase [Microbacterium sp. KUDC0406]
MTFASTDLDAERRRIELERTAFGVVDLLVVGGGITGAGVALDAASRGLSVALIEAEDLAFGTSRFSSKLVHGGLRYLATGDVATARESALERHLLMTAIAPHLIRPLPQLLPFASGVTFRQRSAGAVGMLMGDLLRMRAHTPRATLPGPRAVSARTARRLVPALDPQGLRGGMLSYDGQLVDDARLVVAVARTAAGLGARILTRVRAVGLRGDGATAEDALTGERFEIRARSVVNATGVWAGTLDPAITVRPSRGTHIVLDAADLGHPPAALTVPHPGSISRYVFALPQQHGRVIVGLTDEDAPGPVPRVAEPTEAEIGFLLESVNRVLGEPIARDQVLGAFAGLRPLVDGAAARRPTCHDGISSPHRMTGSCRCWAASSRHTGGWRRTRWTSPCGCARCRSAGVARHRCGWWTPSSRRRNAWWTACRSRGRTSSRRSAPSSPSQRTTCSTGARGWGWYRMSGSAPSPRCRAW